MNCRETKHLLNAYVDGELHSAGSLAVETHMRGCTSCLNEVESLHALASAIENGSLRFKAPAHLKRTIQGAIREANPQPRFSLFSWRWASALASAILVAALTWTVTTNWTRSSEETALVNDIVSSHVRSMLENHVTDVFSSDQHTVKPWFRGKLDYSPPTKDLTEQGFRLVGGRMDYLNNRPVAALVYQRNLHFINLFVWPSNNTGISQEEQLARQGYNLIHWTQAGMTYWLISKLDLPALKECAQLLNSDRE
jgi:anti-sigma factor RsiW